MCNTLRVPMQWPNDTKRSVTLAPQHEHTSCMASGKKTAESVLAGQRVKDACRKAGIDRTELSKRTGIEYSTLGNYEQGTRELPIRAALAIERATDVPAAYIMGLVDEDDMELLRAPRAARKALLEAVSSLAHAATMPPKSIPPFRPNPSSRQRQNT